MKRMKRMKRMNITLHYPITPLVNLTTVNKGSFKWQKRLPNQQDITFKEAYSHPPERELKPIEYFRMFLKMK